jgi:hypothetical protein
MIAKNIPVFIHIPKSGGTYIYNSIRAAARFFLNRICDLDSLNFSNSDDFRFIYRHGKKFPVREINIQEDEKTVFTIFSTDKILNLSEKYNLIELDEYVYYIDLSDKKIKNIISDIDIFSAIAQPRGLKYLKYEIFENIVCSNNENILKFYFPLRDPVERLKSLFFYLRSENSKHEPTHGMYSSSTFEEFIIDEAPNNWIARQLCSLNEEEDVFLEKNFSEVASLISRKNFLLFRIEEIDKMIDLAFKNYGFSFLREVPKKLKDMLTNYNSNNKNYWSYEEGKLTESIKKLYVSKLTEKTLYEYKLFDFIL